MANREVNRADCWLWASVLIRDGEAIAHLQENISAGPVSIGKASPAPLEIDDDGVATLLAALNSRFGRVLGPGECQISLSQVGPSRAKLLDLRAPDPVLVLTQYVRHANRPATQRVLKGILHTVDFECDGAPWTQQPAAKRTPSNWFERSENQVP